MREERQEGRGLSTVSNGKEWGGGDFSVLNDRQLRKVKGVWLIISVLDEEGNNEVKREQPQCPKSLLH